MVEDTTRVVVVGLGAMGAAASYHAARRGADVMGFEQFDVPNALGSSGGESRMFRMCYYEHPDYVPLLQRSCELWRELSNESNTPIVEMTGGLFIGVPGAALIAGSRRAALEHALAHAMLSNRDLRRRFPQFAVTDDMVALFEPTAGVIRPDLAIAAHAQLARRHGARLHAHEPVLEWRAGDGGVVVTTSRRTVRAESLVICAGPWTSRLVGELGSMLTVTRQVLAWVMPEDPAPFMLGSFPVWAIEHGGGRVHYGFPILDASRGLKLGEHAPATPTDPDRVARTSGPDDEHAVRPFLRTFLPGANGPLREIAVCMYTNSPDAHFIIDRHPACPRVHIACGFSGHGFKFAPVVGEALADLALSGTTELPIAFLALSRFA